MQFQIILDRFYYHNCAQKVGKARAHKQTTPRQAACKLS